MHTQSHTDEVQKSLCEWEPLLFSRHELGNRPNQCSCRGSRAMQPILRGRDPTWQPQTNRGAEIKMAFVPLSPDLTTPISWTTRVVGAYLIETELQSRSRRPSLHVVLLRALLVRRCLFRRLHSGSGPCFSVMLMALIKSICCGAEFF
jgi:hypothetical protein